MEYCFTDKDGNYWAQQRVHIDMQGIIPSHSEARRIAAGETITFQLCDGEVVVKSLTTEVVIPRESAKTTQLSVGRVIWELGNNPNLRVKIVTANDNLAKEIVFEISQNIEKNIRIQRVFPELRPDYRAGWSKSALHVMRGLSAGKDATVAAKSVLGTGAGGRADILIFDDVIDFRNAVGNPALRIQVKKSIEDVWIPLMPKDGRCWYSATPWHMSDYTHEIKKNAQWAHYWRPAYWIDPSTQQTIYLWPSKWDPIALNIRRGQIGPRAFSRQFLLVALSDDEATFPETILSRSFDLTPGGKPVRIKIGEKIPPQWPRFCGVDLAIGQKESAARTVIFTIAVDPSNNRRYPVEMIVRRMKFFETIDEIVAQWKKHRWQLLYVENNAYQQAVIEALPESDRSIPILGFNTGAKKFDEEVGLPGLAVVMGNAGWAIPMGWQDHDSECQCPLCIWLDELRSHPLGEFSDTVMATWFGERAAVDGGSAYEANFKILGVNSITEAMKEAKDKANFVPTEYRNLDEIRDKSIITHVMHEKMMWEGMGNN